MHDVIVIGGGLIGMLTARELAMAGLDVTLLERHQTGRESSWAGGGILSPLYPWRYPPSITALASWGQIRYQRLCAELRNESGVDPEWTRSGMLILDTGEEEAARAWAKASGQTLEVAELDHLYSLEPRLGPRPESALWMPQVGQVRNPRAVRALRGALDYLGVTIREDTEVRSIDLGGSRVGAVETEGEKLRADAVVVCGGAWTGELLNALDPRPAVGPVRGQMILFRTRPGLVNRILLDQGHYAIPRRDGRILVGSTLEEVGFDKSITHGAREELHEVAIRLLPVLADYPLEHHWSGLRPSSPQGIPFIGEHPEIRGLFVNAGHYRNGVVLGPASARLLTDLVLQRDTILPPEPYAIDAAR